MAAAPKLTPEQWAHARATWENDPRDGYAWLIDELSLPVSMPAVRKRAASDGWMKNAEFKVSPKVSRKKRRATAKEKPSPKPSERKPGDPVPKSRGLDEIAPELAKTLSPQQRILVEEYAKEPNGKRAAIKAGFSPKSAQTTSSRALTNAKVREAIKLLQADRLDRMSAEADDIVSRLYAIATADAGEISQHRRTCCRHCWGQDFGYQRTPAEYRAHVKQHAKDSAVAEARGLPVPEFDEEGGFGYNGTFDPNPECPECFGEGIGSVYIADTRHLSPGARLLFAGVEITQNGLKALTRSQDKAHDALLRIMGLYQPGDAGPEADEINVDELERRYAERMRAARERQRQVFEERGQVIEGESAVDPE